MNNKEKWVFLITYSIVSIMVLVGSVIIVNNIG